MKFFYLTWTLFLACNPLLSQTETPPPFLHQLSIEGGGLGGFGTITYQYRLTRKSKWNVGLAAGVSTIRLKNFQNKFQPDLVFPLSAIAWYQKGSHHPEAGLAQVYTSTSKFDVNSGNSKRTGKFSFATLLGYRFQKPGNRFLVKVNYYLIFENYDQWRHWPGLSIGWAIDRK